MSVYNNQTNVSPGSAFFAPIGGGGGGGTPSNWSSYPALTTITYSGEGGIANFTELNCLNSLSTPYILAETIESSSQITSPLMATVSFQTSTINGSAYPPSSGGAITGNYSSFVDYTFDATIPVTGCLSTSIVLATYISSNAGVANNIQRITPGTDSFYIKFAEQFPPGANLNYAIFSGSK